jgi:hypothetical protein
MIVTLYIVAKVKTFADGSKSFSARPTEDALPTRIWYSHLGVERRFEQVAAPVCGTLGVRVLFCAKIDSPSASASTMNYPRHLPILDARALARKVGNPVRSRPFVLSVADHAKPRPFRHVRFPRVVA